MLEYSVDWPQRALMNLMFVIKYEWYVNIIA